MFIFVLILLILALVLAVTNIFVVQQIGRAHV